MPNDDPSTSYNISGSISLKGEMPPEKVEELLRALGSLGLNLHLQGEAGQLADNQNSKYNALPDRFVSLGEMRSFAERQSIRSSVIGRAWRSLARLCVEGDLSLVYFIRGREPPSVPYGFPYVTHISINSIRKVVAIADGIVPTDTPWNQTGREYVNKTLGSGIGPVSIGIYRGFLAEADKRPPPRDK